MDELVRRVLATYPQVYFACHVRHPRPRNTTGAVTPRDISVLCHLASGAIGIGQLARHMGLTQSTMSGAIQSLESRGFLTRHRQDPDRRHVTLELTAAGREVAANDSVLDPERVAGALGMMSEADRERAVQGLGLFAAAAREWTASQPAKEGFEG